RAANLLNPPARDAIFVPLEKAGDDFLGQSFVEVLAIDSVLFFDGIGMGIRTDRKTVRAVVAFAPPAIEYAHIEAAVAAGLLAAGAGSFERSARIVQPNIAARDHLPRDVNIVTLDENKMALEFAVFAQVNDVLNVTLAGIIARMSFPSEDELDRTT